MSKIYTSTAIEDINLTGRNLADIKVQVLDENGNYNEVTITSFADLTDYMLHMYGGRVFLSKHYHEPTQSEIATYFTEMWNNFYGSDARQKNWGVLYRAMLKKYDPMENYDKYSTITTAKEGLEQTQFDNGPAGYTDTTTSSVSPDVSETYYNSQKAETEYGAKVETTVHSFDDRQDIVTEHTHGNIGVTMAAQILTAEVNARINLDIMELLVQQFIYQFTY